MSPEWSGLGLMFIRKCVLGRFLNNENILVYQNGVSYYA